MTTGRTVARLAGVLAVLMATAASLRAHEKGVLSPATREPAAGDSLRIGGKEFGKRTTLHLVLVGVAGRIALGQVTTESAGTFVSAVLVPADAAPGQYRLVAVAADGDEVAALDLVVRPPAAAATEPPHADRGMGTATMERPSANPLRLDRARSPAVTWSVVGGIVVAVALAGVLLLRGPERGH